MISYLLMLSIFSLNTHQKIETEDFKTLKYILESLNERERELAIKAPFDFLKDFKDLILIDDEILILVDKSKKLDENFEAKDLINLDEFKEIKVNKKGIKLKRIVLKDLIAMLESAKSENVDLLILSAHRTKEYQEYLFNFNKEKYGLKIALIQSAMSRHSQHELGTTIDFISLDENLIKTKEGEWLFKNAAKFGFSLSYPKGYESETGYKWEPWHYRYITKSGTFIERKYFNNLQYKFLEFWNKNRESIKRLVEKYIN